MSEKRDIELELSAEGSSGAAWSVKLMVSEVQAERIANCANLFSDALSRGVRNALAESLRLVIGGDVGAEDAVQQARRVTPLTSPGPWDMNGAEACCWITDADGETIATFEGPKDASDARFCADARTLVPALSAEVERLREHCRLQGNVLKALGEMNATAGSDDRTQARTAEGAYEDAVDALATWEKANEAKSDG